MAPAPWESVPNHETYFILVTGANSGIGFGIGERIIDEYLSTHSLNSHIVVIPTTRSVKKSTETVLGLRRHAREFAETSEVLRSRTGPGYNPKDTTRRIHILSVQLDLCNLETVRDAAKKLASGTLSGPAGDADYFTPLVDVRIPRLDSVIFNAGIGGFTGLDWPKLIRNFLIDGPIAATTWPTFKSAAVGSVIAAAPSKSDAQLGEVFCANVFGHYFFAHALLPLLTRTGSDAAALPPARIIWESSVEGDWTSHSLDDFQGIKTTFAYESSKRLTDMLCLTAGLPASRPYVDSYLRPADPSLAKGTRPRIYLVHPGVVQTTIFPVNAFLFFWYRVVLYVVRWIGSPWHPITTYNGAAAAVWVALQEQAALDAVPAERVKWGSATDRAGNCFVKKTEVWGWGWDGCVAPRRYEEEGVTGVLRRAIGRRHGAVELTDEKLVEFQVMGAECWKEMERLRVEWEARL